MNFYEKIIIGFCIISILTVIIMTSIKYPIYEIYISDFYENETHFVFDISMKSDVEIDIYHDVYINGEYFVSGHYSGTKQHNFVFSAYKNKFKESQNKVEFRFYGTSENAKFFGSKEKPYTLHKWVTYEKD